MVSNFEEKDISKINKLGEILNSNFTKLFHIENLNPNEKIFVYKEDNIIKGFLHININYETIEILNLIVDKEYRNNNIATLLLDHLISTLPNNIINIILEVKEDNLPAIKLYNRFNFEQINVRKKYYDSSDAIVMERKFQ